MHIGPRSQAIAILLNARRSVFAETHPSEDFVSRWAAWHILRHAIDHLEAQC